MVERANSNDIRTRPPANRHETRALWSWAGRDATSKQDIDELVAKIDKAHLNTILLLVYYQGTAFFEPSHTRFPDSANRLPNQSPFSEEGYEDALSYLLAVRDQRRSDDDPFNDFEVHAWLTVTDSGNWRENGEWPRPDDNQPYMLHYLHPEFKIKYSRYYLRRDERYVNHRYSVIHQPKFRAYIVNLVGGLVEDYAIDGIHLDYIRAMTICYNNEPLDYPGTEYDYPGCQQDYKNWTRSTFGREHTLWQDTDGHGEIRDGGSGRVAAWQAKAVSALVQNIHEEVKSTAPNAIISAAVGATLPSNAKVSKQGQLAWEWLDSGWIDAAFVMSYYADTQTVIDKNQEFVAAIQQKAKVSTAFPGLATYTISEKGDEWSDLIVEQIDAVMHGQWKGPSLEPPARGIALFNARYLSEEAIEALVQGPFKEPALPFWGANKTTPSGP